MGILQVSNQDPVAFKKSGRYYNPKNWDKQSEDLRGKPWAEVFDLIQKQFKNERLDMQKLKDLLGRLAPNTNWSRVVTDLNVFFAKYDQENKPSAWGEITYNDADELRYQRKKLLNALQARVDEYKEKQESSFYKFVPETSSVPEAVEVNPDVEEIEHGFIKVQDREDKERKEYGLRKGEHALNRVSPRNKRISAERGARARRKDERRYF